MEYLLHPIADAQNLHVPLSTTSPSIPPSPWRGYTCLRKEARHARRNARTGDPLLIPIRMVRNVVRMRGGEGEEWLRRLPGLVVHLRERWEIEVGRPFEGIWYNWVAPARRADGTPTVLKLCVPGDEEFASGGAGA